jgi:hypothetical protein
MRVGKKKRKRKTKHTQLTIKSTACISCAFKSRQSPRESLQIQLHAAFVVQVVPGLLTTLLGSGNPPERPCQNSESVEAEEETS